jgi:hypothetical protein
MNVQEATKRQEIKGEGTEGMRNTPSDKLLHSRLFGSPQSPGDTMAGRVTLHAPPPGQHRVYAFTHPAFVRYLMCNRCGDEQPIGTAMREGTVKWTCMHGARHIVIEGRCPYCKNTTTRTIKDRLAPSGVSVTHFIPGQQIHLLTDGFAPDRYHYVWDMPGHLRDDVFAGTKQVLETLPLGIIDAIIHYEYFKFDPKYITEQHWQTPLTGQHIALPNEPPVKQPQPEAGLVNKAWTCEDGKSEIRRDPVTGNEYVTGLTVRGQPLNNLAPTARFLCEHCHNAAELGDLIGEPYYEPMDAINWFLTRCKVECPACHILGSYYLDSSPAAYTEKTSPGGEVYTAHYEPAGADNQLPVSDGCRKLTELLRDLIESQQRSAELLVKVADAYAALVPLAEAAEHSLLMQQMAKLQLVTGGQVASTAGLKSIGTDYKEMVNQAMAEQEQAAIANPMYAQSLQQAEEAIFKDKFQQQVQAAVTRHCEATQPAPSPQGKPDITPIAMDIYQVKQQLCILFQRMGLPLPPTVKDEFMADFKEAGANI